MKEQLRKLLALLLSFLMLFGSMPVSAIAEGTKERRTETTNMVQPLAVAQDGSSIDVFLVPVVNGVEGAPKNVGKWEPSRNGQTAAWYFRNEISGKTFDGETIKGTYQQAELRNGSNRKSFSQLRCRSGIISYTTLGVKWSDVSKNDSVYIFYVPEQLTLIIKDATTGQEINQPITLAPNETKALKAELSNGQPFPEGSVLTWMSNADTVATVDQNGVVTFAFTEARGNNVATSATITATLTMADGSTLTDAVTVRADVVTISFNVNGGSGQIDSIVVPRGTTITLPDGTGLSKDSSTFMGWGNDSGSGMAYAGDKTIYPAGYEHNATENKVFYAVWATSADALYFIRLDGTIPYEPQTHGTGDYTAEDSTNMAGTVKYNTYYMNSSGNGVRDHLGTIPSTANIWQACEKKASSIAGYESCKTADEFASKYYVLWYVIKQSPIHVDGVLLKKSQYNVTYEPGALAGQYTGNPPNGRQYGSGATVTVEGNTGNLARRGYTFGGWKCNIDNRTYQADDTLTMPARNVVFTAIWIPDGETAYTVEFYYQQNGAYPEKTNSSVVRYAETDASVSVTEDDKTPSEGYAYEVTENTKESGTVAGDGSLVLRLYFKQQFTVTYNPGDHGTFPETTNEGLAYGAETPEPPADYDVGDAGYKFDGWTPEVQDTVTGDIVYTAKWTQQTYTVEHYVQNLDSDADGVVYDLLANETETFPINGDINVGWVEENKQKSVTTSDLHIAPGEQGTYACVLDAAQTEPSDKAKVVVDGDVIKLYYNRIVTRGTFDDGKAVTAYDGGGEDKPAEIRQGQITIVTHYVGGQYAGATYSSTLDFRWQQYNCVDVKANNDANKGYIINKVFAEQVKGKNDAKPIEVSNNSATIDNVKGNSTVHIYLTPKYTVEYTQDGAPYTVNHLWNGTEEKVAPSEEFTDQVFDSTVTASPLTDIQGYTPVSTEAQEITIQVEGNVINFYYYKNVTVKADDKSKAYGEEAPGLTANVTSEAEKFTDAEKETITYELSFANGEPQLVGEYKDVILAKGDEKQDDGKYLVTFLPGAFTVTGNPVVPEKATPEVEANYNLGDQIPFTITVTNVTTEVLTNITVTDPTATLAEGDGYTLSGNTATIAELASGASVAITALHTVTEQDILQGTYGNTATVTVEDQEYPATATTEKLEEAKASLTLTKTIDNTPARGYFLMGETAEFTITVTNDGNLTLTDVAVSEQLAGAVIAADEAYTVDGSTAKIDSLAPNGTVAIKATYQITLDDLRADENAAMLRNIVTANGKAPEDVPNPEETTAEVPVPTDTFAEIAGTKVWNDENNAFGTRPEAITLSLYSGQTKLNEVQATAESGWTYTFGKLPMHDADGNVIPYLVQDEVTGYDAEMAQNYQLTNNLRRYTLTIRYWYDRVGGLEASATVMRSYFYGQSYNVVSPGFAGYTADRARVTGVMTGDTQYDVVYTRNNYTITVNYVYQNGTTAAPTYTGTLGYDDAYFIQSPVLRGYTASARAIAGSMEGRNVVYTVIYVPDTVTVVIDEYGVPLGIGAVEMNVGDCFE